MDILPLLAPVAALTRARYEDEQSKGKSAVTLPGAEWPRAVQTYQPSALGFFVVMGWLTQPPPRVMSRSSRKKSVAGCAVGGVCQAKITADGNQDTPTRCSLRKVTRSPAAARAAR